jgi:signal transduction histidine kinase/CheY-like chemotaxis protein
MGHSKKQIFSGDEWIKRRACLGFAAFVITIGVPFFGSFLSAQETAPTEARFVAPGVLTSFEQIWQLSESEQRQWHRLRLDFVVYYYDPLWKAMWGRCGEAENYLSLGNKVFPIRAGMRILVEGLIQPAKGPTVEEPKVTVLAESAPLEVLSTQGRVGETDRFSKRLVTVEGLVERQTIRDSNHMEVGLIADDRLVTMELLLKSDEVVPQLKDAVVRAQGVFFARTDPEGGGPKIELWVQRKEDVEILGSLDRDKRFDVPAVLIRQLPETGSDKLVRIVGTVQAQHIGQTVTIRDESGRATVRTLQNQEAQVGEMVEAIGYPVREENEWGLRQGIFRSSETVITRVNQIYELSEADKRNRHRVRLEMLVYYYDPQWRGLWGRVSGADEYVDLGTKAFSIKPGQRILIEGSVLPATGQMVVDDPRVTVLAEGEPLEAVPTSGRIGETERFNRSIVLVEGLVDRQSILDRVHHRLDLVVEGRPVVARLLVDEGVRVPSMEGALIRVKGVYSATPDPATATTTIEVWARDMANVEVIGSLARDERFSRPITPIEKLPSVKPEELVRVVGIVRAQEAGKSVTIRDATGQVVVQTMQTQSVKLGDTIEAIGVATARGHEWSLRGGLYRPAATPLAPPSSGLPALRLAEQLRELPPNEAARNYPVHLTGVVTWAHRDADFFYLQDGSGGALVVQPANMKEPVIVGRMVDVIGVSSTGRFTPEVLAASLGFKSSVDLPEAKTVTLEQALTGIEEDQWVSMSGYVRDLVRDGRWTRLQLTTAAGDFAAVVPPSDLLEKLRGSAVRVRGVCRAMTNSKRQLTGIELWVPSAGSFEVEEPVPAEPFKTIEARPIASLRQFSSQQGFNRRVRVSGTVIHQAAGRLVHIQEGNEALLVLSRDRVLLALGDRIEAVGFPGRENNRVVLREAVYRRVAAGEQPVPLKVKQFNPIDAEFDGRVVEVEGTLLDVGAQENGTRLLLQSESGVFEALLDLKKDDLDTRWVPGSRVALTGVYLIQFDEYRRPEVVHLQLRTQQDLHLLRSPSWWTVRRVLSLAGLLAIGLVLGLSWVFVLRRRVQQQTDLIREQLEKEKAARLDAALARTSKLESLGVLAGGIAHDFNNLLTVVMGNLSLAKLDTQCEAETRQYLTEGERAAMRARDLTQQLLTFAKGGEPVREAALLEDIVREATNFALHGSKVSCEFEIDPDLWPANVDRGQIAQVVHNVIINANHAMPQGGVIRIVLRNDSITVEGRPGLAPGRYLKLSVADTGSGISAENLARVFEPYFTTKSQGSGLGLTTAYSIVKKHQGHIEVESKIGKGTVFHIWLPAAERPPALVAAEQDPRPQRAGRILFMDDEPQIRQMAVQLLQRMGLQVTAVDDGSAVVLEYVAARDEGRPYDLVILDLTVPGGMGGAKAMEKLRHIDPHVRAIVSSGYSSDPVLANYRAHGFCGIIPKPYVVSEVAKAIDAVLHTRET